MTTDELLHSWVEQLRSRHTERLTFSELRRGLQALSAVYVHDRHRLERGAALDGAGKRAAFAAFYGPLHFMLVRHVIAELEVGRPPPRDILDLGCGTGVIGAAWAIPKPTDASGRSTALQGVDVNPWALEEARWNALALGVTARFKRADVTRLTLPTSVDAIACGFVVNELDDASRQTLLSRLVQAGARGARVLVVEPIARRPLTWWNAWSEAFVAASGRQDEWRFRVELPEFMASLDQAARLDHRELTGRSLYLPGRAAAGENHAEQP